MRTAVLNAACSQREPEASERWRFTGESVRHPEHGDQLRCRVALPLLPSGQGIVRLLAESRRFPGIGRRTAMRLWGALGVRLYDVLSARDYEAVADVIGVELTAVVIDGFGLLSVEVTALRWLDEHDVDPQTAATALQLWGGGVIARMEADPYALALLEPWAAVDRRALAMGVYPSDDRRLVAAVEEAAAAVWRRRDTASGRQDLERMVLSLLGPGAGEHACRAVEMAERLRLLLPSPDGLQLQNRAAHFMEREVECRLVQLLDPGSDDTLNENVRRTDRASATLDVASLSSEQNAAILLASTMRLCVIHGAAGTGKTTVVRGIVSAHLARDPSATVRLVAISGRAASRLDAALGEDGALNDERPGVPRACAMTVARFLREAAVLKTRPPSMLIVDEASMIDLPTAYQLLRAIPPNARVIMVGDPAQLPPIGPGLVFHRLVGDAVVPQLELRTVHRQEADTGIPQVAGAIRCGCLPALPMFDPDDALAAGVRIAPCRQSEIAATTLEVWRAMSGPPEATPGLPRTHGLDIQILAATRAGTAGVDALNDAADAMATPLQPDMPGWGLRLGSRVVWLKNDYGKGPLLRPDGTPSFDSDGSPRYRGFMNGATGVVRRLGTAQVLVEFDDGAADWVRAHELKGMGLGWAISVHKAQGSAFRRIIVPIVRIRLLERSWLYTAVTRAELTCVLVGDQGLLSEIIAASPAAGRRSVTLSFPRPRDGHGDQDDMTAMP